MVSSFIILVDGSPDLPLVWGKNACVKRTLPIHLALFNNLRYSPHPIILYTASNQSGQWEWSENEANIMVLVAFYVSCVVILSHLCPHKQLTLDTQIDSVSRPDKHKARTVQIYNVKYKYITVPSDGSKYLALYMLESDR